MQKLFKIFITPYPLPTNSLTYREVLRISGSISALLILMNFLGGVAIENWLSIIAFLVVMTGTLFVNSILIPKIFPLVFSFTDWVVWKELLWIFFNFISISFYGILCFTFLGWSSLTMDQFINFFGTTLAYGIGPVVILIIHRQNKLLTKHVEGSKQLGELVINDTSDQLDESIILKSVVGLKQVHVLRKDLILLEASKNDVKIYSCEGNQVMENTIRATLKLIEEQLSNHPEFIRCHRAFIVNKNYISQLSGNAQGLKITLAQTNLVVPVSRSYVKEFKHKIGQPI